jgi:MOSC domain-containing protein YiiM
MPMRAVGEVCEDGPMPARVVSVNVGRPVAAQWVGRPYKTSIHKHPVAGTVAVDTLGVAGDQVSDTKFHGGQHLAVYAFAREDLDVWAERLGKSIPDGHFGENLTTSGIDVNDALIGERWSVGTAVFELSDVRIPCHTFDEWMKRTGYQVDKWIKTFMAEGRPGPYLRVVQPGHISAGDELTVVHKPDHDITVTTMFRALTTERALLPRLFDVGEGLAPIPREAAKKYAART